MLHRDIKPGNILVKRYGTVGLADFGLAAVVEAGRDSSVTLAALTPAYAAPEAFHLHPPTVQSDVYALAATLYTLLAGFPPRFPAEGDLSVPEIVRRHDSPIDDIPGLAPELMAVLRRGLATDPTHRYAEAAALRADLDHLTTGDIAGPRHAVTRAVTTVAAPRPSVPRPSIPPRSPVPAPPSYPPIPAQSYPQPFSGPPPQAFSGPGSGPVPLASPTGPAPSTRRPLLVAGAALAVLLLLLAGVWYLVLRDTGRDTVGAGSGAGDPTTAVDDTHRFGVPTVTEDCPAAQVAGAGARCTKRPQCWSGIVLIQGQLTSVRELPCAEGHVYETFAIAVVPPAVVDPYQDKLAADQSVQQVCSPATMLASRFGDALKYAADKWSIEVLPPTPEDREQGRDIYRCVATLTGVEGITGSVFRPH